MSDSLVFYVGAPIALALVGIIGVWVKNRRGRDT